MSEKIVQLNEEVIKGQIKELVRGSVEETLNGLLEAEAEKLTQAAKYERSEERQGYRSGHYSRNLTTTSGDVTLNVPRLKEISFETAIIERYRRGESSVEEALIEMYLAGVSVRRVEDITEALWGSKVSPSNHQRAEQESLRPYRGLAKPTAAWRALPVCLCERHLPAPQLGRRVRKRSHSGGNRSQRGRLPGGFGCC